MKKFVIITTILATTMTFMAGCDKKEEPSASATPTPAATEETSELPAEPAIEPVYPTPQTEAIEPEGSVRTGLGISSSISGSTEGKAQLYSYIAALTVDSNDTIVDCKIDALQANVNIDENGVVEKLDNIQTKVELGDAYGMKTASSIGKEWGEQATAFANYAIGKTVEEVKGMKTYAKDENHPVVPEEADLVSSVTIDVSHMMEAIDKASKNLTEPAEAEGLVRVGLGLVANSTKSKDAEDGKGVAEINSPVAVVAIDSTGKTVNAILDAIQVKIEFDDKGEIISDLNMAAPTKNELGDDYGMRESSSIDKEWYEQARAFADSMAGEEVDLATSVTVTTDAYEQAFSKAITSAK